MSLSRSPSPQRGGGWASPGLSDNYVGGSRRASPARTFTNGSANNVSWASAQARSAEVRGYPAFTPRGKGLFGHMRSVSFKLPSFNANGQYAEKEKLGRGRWSGRSNSRLRDALAMIGRAAWKLRLRLALILFFLLLYPIYFLTPLYRFCRHHFGQGYKYVVILGANEGGGVMEWKGAREWAIERDSLRNKKHYIREWGYELEVVDMSTKKRYAHEWRESWEKVDAVRATMKKYPKAEWFWWLDLNTFIMEPSYSLQRHIFNDLNANTYRDINVYNPLGIEHPLNASYLDEESLSPIGDGKPDSINLIIPQDCSGFNLGSFFVRRSIWTERIFDIWWDPVAYEQKHMAWEHKEQDALEYMYRNQPWIRPHVAFVPQRKINSFPPGACGESGDDPKIHYHEQDRDFMVNMAGCEWGRDCWGEMYSYRQLSHQLNRNLWERLVDGVRDWWKGHGEGGKTKEGPSEKRDENNQAS